MTTAAHETHTAHEVREELPQGKRPERARGGAARVVASVMRVASLQTKIWLTQAKIATMRMVLFVALYAAAGVVGVLGIIFLYLGLFRVLTDVAGLAPVWAYLIFAGVHIALAAVLAVVGQKILSRPIDDDEDEAAHEKNLAGDERK